MFLFGKFGVRRPPLRAAIDIGVHAIKSVIFEPGDGEAPPRVAKNFFVKLLPSIDPPRVIVKFREEIFNILRFLGRMPERIVVGVGERMGGEFSMGHWRVQSVKHERALSESTLASYFNGLLAERREPGKTIIAHPVSLVVNGYTADPRSVRQLKPEKIDELEFRTLAVVFPEAVGAALLETRAMFGGIPIEFLPQPLLYREAIEHVNSGDAFFIEIGGARTLMLLCLEGEIREIAAFPKGAHELIRAMTERLGIKWEEAEEWAKQYAGGLTNTRTTELIRGAIQRHIEEWKTQFLEALDTFYTAGPIPKTVYLFGEGAFFPEFGTFLRTKEWIEHASYVTAPQVQLLEGRMFFQGSSLGGFLKGPDDVGLALLVRYSLHRHNMF